MSLSASPQERHAWLGFPWKIVATGYLIASAAIYQPMQADKATARNHGKQKNLSCLACRSDPKSFLSKNESKSLLHVADLHIISAIELVLTEKADIL